MLATVMAAFRGPFGDSAANAMFQVLFQLGQVAGPATAGLLLAGAGVRFVYWIDVASFGAALLLARLLPGFRHQRLR